jgi:hypothetical protein
VAGRALPHAIHVSVDAASVLSRSLMLPHVVGYEQATDVVPKRANESEHAVTGVDALGGSRPGEEHNTRPLTSIGVRPGLQYIV